MKHVVLEIGGKDVKCTLKELKALYADLKQLLEPPMPYVYPSTPLYDQLNPITAPVITYSTGGTSG